MDFEVFDHGNSKAIPVFLCELSLVLPSKKIFNFRILARAFARARIEKFFNFLMILASEASGSSRKKFHIEKVFGWRH